ncbi:hypothetical protein KIPB_000520 [Kipferlia bialata]|uniref:Uncharacterized protein n=1 Tax=Kipferlia bialata TaxID=797122 RepID=A0A9K3CNQ6_9EUKA|nr:hypothetical protein KIPB_000520 [Kipferlia bialata]|eukprot:g520.t1
MVSESVCSEIKAKYYAGAYSACVALCRSTAADGWVLLYLVRSLLRAEGADAAMQAVEDNPCEDSAAFRLCIDPSCPVESVGDSEVASVVLGEHWLRAGEAGRVLFPTILS